MKNILEQPNNNKNEYVTREYFDNKFDELGVMIKGGFDDMGARISGVENRMDRLEQMVQNISNELQNVSKRLDQLEWRVEQLAQKVDKFDEKADRLIRMEDEDVKAMQADVIELRKKQNMLEQKVLEMERQNAGR
ncbi:MAG: hypothetical protein Q8Q23_00205 [bacterium]|nr:hypothetical protein [bacterium]